MAVALYSCWWGLKTRAAEAFLAFSGHYRQAANSTGYFREVSRSGMTCFFTANAANGYWAVSLHRPHAYKTVFDAYDGQYS